MPTTLVIKAKNGEIITPIADSLVSDFGTIGETMGKKLTFIRGESKFLSSGEPTILEISFSFENCPLDTLKELRPLFSIVSQALKEKSHLDIDLYFTLSDGVNAETFEF